MKVTMNQKSTKKSLKQSEKGIVSIVVTVIIMLILTLIVIGFARLSRREQQQSLDRELNTQAFYAAESAVNDVKKKFEDGAVSLNTDYMTDCNEFTTVQGFTKTISSSSEYSCLLVDPSPTNLEYKPISTASSQVIPLKSKNSGVAISSVTISWQPADGTGHNQASCPSSGTFPEDWDPACKVGMLRVDLVPFTGAFGLSSRNNLIAQTFTGFMHPISGGGSVGYSSGTGTTEAGLITNGNCNGSGQCSVTITGLPLTTGTVGLVPVSYMRIRSIYKNNNVQITAVDSANNPIELAGAQAVVDATGKSSGVLRRIQVRFGINKFGETFPENALQTTDTICKRYTVAAPSTVNIDAVGADAAACAIN